MGRALNILMVVISAALLSVACSDDDGNEGAGSGVGSGAGSDSGSITYNSSTEEILSAFCQSDEDTIILYFSPDEVAPATIGESRYYVKITLDAYQLNEKELDPTKGEVLVELYDIERGLRLKAIGGTASIRGTAHKNSYNLMLNIALNEEGSAVAVRYEGECRNVGAINYANKLIYVHEETGAIDSVIWSAFIDTREVNMWHIYLAPVKNITFEEVSYFSPIKISLPVDFPLDGLKYLISESADISIEYRKERWNASNAPKGSIRATYEIKPGIFTIRFTTNGKLRGAYCGPIEIIE